MSDRYSALQETIAEYGNKTRDWHVAVRKIGPEIIQGFARYIEAPAGNVFGVPPTGGFTLGVEYRDEIYNFHGDELRLIEPVFMGIAVDIHNLNDNGSTGVMTVIELRPAGDSALIAFGNGSVLYEAGNKDVMTTLCDYIYQDIAYIFDEYLNNIKDRSRFGFTSKSA